MHRALLVSCFALAASGCQASAPPPPPRIVDAEPVPEKVDTGPSSMEAEIGGLDEYAMDKAFASLDVSHCIEPRAAELDQLGGELHLKLRIDRRGSTRWAYLSRSTLGDRAAEKCVLDLARAKSWPKPLSGEGLAEKDLVVDPRAEPIALEERGARVPIAQARTEAAKCKRGVPGSFLATVYVQPDGRVATAGVSVPSEKGEDVADCVVEALRKVRFRAAPKATKLSFEIR
jgi:hypothetical protein